MGRFACKWWTVNLHQNASLTTTHDLGFMIFPWAKLAWNLNHDTQAYDTIIRASRSLALRYSPSVGAIRSWDTCTTKRYSFQDPSEDFLVIIVSIFLRSRLVLLPESVLCLFRADMKSSRGGQDNMMNLDMLFWAASEMDDQNLYQMAKSHARTSMKHHVRSDNSTAHVVVFDPQTGALKSKITHQGYSDESAWARGQAWAIAGFAQTYLWTDDDEFLQAAQNCADYFLAHMPSSRVPPWDFTAPHVAGETVPPDTSAGVIAAYGMLLIQEAHTTRGRTSRYLREAIDMLAGICAAALNPPSRFVALESQLPVETIESGTKLSKSAVGVEVEENGSPQTILGGATINNYEFAPRRWADHGLVYADYYFLLCGNKLLEMNVAGLVKGTLAE